VGQEQTVDKETEKLIKEMADRLIQEEKAKEKTKKRRNNNNSQ